MSDNTPCLEVRSPSGELLLTVGLKTGTPGEVKQRLQVQRAPDKPPQKQNRRDAPTYQPGKPTMRGNEATQDGEPMTEAQKRFLFRILAEQGIEGDKAYETLKTLFHANSLKQVSKLEASKGIERLLEDTKGGGS